MTVARWIGNAIWLVAMLVLVVWVCEGLFATDQTTSIIPGAAGSDVSVVVILAAVVSGFMAMLGAVDFVGRPRDFNIFAPNTPSGLTEVAVGTVLEVSRTGSTINDVPQYDIFVRVTPGQGEPFVSKVRMPLDAADVVGVQKGVTHPVSYNPNDADLIAFAEPTDPAVQEMMLQWRIDRGLVDPRLVAARRNGIVAPASVIAIRPTGRRREGNVEVQLRLLVTPVGGSQPWEVETTSFMYPDALPRVQVGSPVYAMYEPHDPFTVAMRIELGTEATP